MSGPYVPPTGMPSLGALVNNYVNVENHTGDAAALARIAALEAIGDGRPAYVVGYHAAYTNVLEAAVAEALDNIGPSLGPFVFNGNLNLDNGVEGYPANVISSPGNNYIVPSVPTQGQYSVSTQCADWPVGSAALDVGKFYIVKIPGNTTDTFRIKVDQADTTPVDVEHNDSVAITLAQDGVTKTFQKIDNAVTNIDGTTYTSVTRASGTNTFTIDLSQSSKTSLGLANSSIQSVAAAAGNSSITVGAGATAKNVTVKIADGYTSTINETLTEIMTRLQTVTTFMGFIESTGQFFDNNGNPVTFSSNMAITSEPFDSTSLLSLGTNGIVGFPSDANDLHVASGSPGSATLTSTGTGFQRTITLDYIPLASPPNDLDKSQYYWRILDSSRAVVPFGNSSTGNTVWSTDTATLDSYAGAYGYAFYNSSGVEQPNLVLDLTFTTPGSYFLELFREVPNTALPRGIPVGPAPGTPTAVVFIQSLSIEAPANVNALTYTSTGTLFSDLSGNVSFSGTITYENSTIPNGSTGVLTLGTKQYASVSISTNGNFTVNNIGTTTQLMPTGADPEQDNSFEVTFLATIDGVAGTVPYTAATNLPKIVDVTISNFSLSNTTNPWAFGVSGPTIIGDVLELGFQGPITNLYDRIDYALHDGPFTSGSLTFTTGTTSFTPGGIVENTLSIPNTFASSTNDIYIYLRLSDTNNNLTPHTILLVDGNNSNGPKLFGQYSANLPSEFNMNDASSSSETAYYDPNNDTIVFGNSFNLFYLGSTVLTMTNNWPTEIGTFSNGVYTPYTNTSIATKFFNGSSTELPIVINNPSPETEYTLYVSSGGATNAVLGSASLTVTTPTAIPPAEE